MRIGDGQVITTTIEGVVFIAREIIVLPVGIVNLGLYVYETCDQTVEQYARLVYGITKRDGSGYNRIVQFASTKSKVGGAITNGEYRS